jgi:ELWxxDGT repeat protein
LTDITPGPDGSIIRQFISGGHGVAYFMAEPGNGSDGEVWRTDGTAAGTYKLTNLEPGVERSFAEPDDLFFAPDGSLYFNADTQQYGQEPWRLPPAGAAGAGGTTVVDRGLFYGDATHNSGKHALLPGAGGGSFDNVSSYSGGINSVSVDIAGARPGTVLSRGGFSFDVSSGGPTGTWTPAPSPLSFIVAYGGGVNGSDRVVFQWADGLIRNRWLRVTARPGNDTGLLAPDVFYFGSLVGETGDAASPLRVSALDLAGVKRAFNTSVDITSPYDINRDGRVNALDLAAVRGNLSRALPQIMTAAARTLAVPATDALREESGRDVIPPPTTVPG